ncbi:hypothetical protein QTJ16_003475 [Diplocarpon rosae]|uniref:Fibronectin type-III domain-containing protein n=1 Tax=Diplocarpon rosae TaxID=946125 RepID=A0AAD9T2F3_9HELO|nr:hypothetical protein QTJ16_003475 [Diplocarpon rosae]PBP21632.1 fibronectin type III domain-containing protein [Diplocarpon rosae]
MPDEQPEDEVDCTGSRSALPESAAKVDGICNWSTFPFPTTIAVLSTVFFLGIYIDKLAATSRHLRVVQFFLHRMLPTVSYDLVAWLLGHGHLIMLILQSTATASAFLWLLYRAYKTLRTPVSHLIETLGVEVPDAPEVTLAGLKSNACTIQWSRPGSGSHKAVAKYFIQVNGVNVGESSRLETAIEVTGLKSRYFYNIRVIAVGGNNFQAGSKVLRIATLCKDGQPHRGDTRSAAEQDVDDQASDFSDDAQPGRGHGVEIQAATLPESAPIPLTREYSGGSLIGQRRNTGGRKHSPSTAAADQAAREAAIANQPQETMHKLTEVFETARRDTDRIVADTAIELDDFKRQQRNLERERDAKKQALKDREETSEKLKREVTLAERANRASQNKKTQREKVLREKLAENQKMRNDVARWKRESQDMKKEKESWKREKEKLAKKKDSRIAKIKGEISQKQIELERLENDIHNLGLQNSDLEAERKKLPGSEENEETQAQDATDRREELEWQARENGHISRLTASSQRLREIEFITAQHQAHLTALQQTLPVHYSANSSGVDFDAVGASTVKSGRTRNRKSRTGLMSSPIAGQAPAGSQFSSAGSYNNLHGNVLSPSFAPGPYIEMNTDTGMVIQSDHTTGVGEEEIRMLTSEAPLSPTAASLLPSNIFADDDHDEREGRPFPDNIGETLDKDPQSPDSSSRSASLLSSPQISSQSLALYGVATHEYPNENDRAGFGTMKSPPMQPAAHKSLKSMFSLPRSRGKSVAGGPTLGSLKQGQSQSLPRSTEEPESLTRSRRLSFSSGWPTFFKGQPTSEPSTQGNAPAPARNVGVRSRRGFNVFRNSMDDSIARSERDPSSPRPTSIASSDLPRPSTDSAPFGWGPAPDLINRNSPLATHWSIHAPPSWSRNPSRRPSLQRGSSSALNTGIASDDDEFLPASDYLAGQSSPPAVGVIGPRRVSSHKSIAPALNPAAPAFMGFNFGLISKSNKDMGKEKAISLDNPISSDEALQNISDVPSPAASRKSRDTHSIRTQNSMAESHESLDRTLSNATSDLNTSSGAGVKDNAFKQLLRKGSSSKFSISSFRSKDKYKGISSTPSSDRGLGDNHDGSFDELGEGSALGRSVESMATSPMLGSSASGKEKDGGTTKMWTRFALKKGKGKESSEIDRNEKEIVGDEACV